MKHLVGKTMTEKVSFMGDEIEVKKLSVGDILKVQRLTKEHNKRKNPDEAALMLLRDVIKMAVVGAQDLTDEEFDTFPLEELNKVSVSVLKLSGVNDQGQSEGN